jgi:hypothetical protein
MGSLKIIVALSFEITLFWNKLCPFFSRKPKDNLVKPNPNKLDPSDWDPRTVSTNSGDLLPGDLFPVTLDLFSRVEGRLCLLPSGRYLLLSKNLTLNSSH